jgi:CRISPR-associated endonuclease/helicase Cas3
MTYDELFQRATGWQPFPWQQTFASSDVLPEVIRVPTGAGKTEAAALGWLWRRRFADPAIRVETPRRLVYCLPMRVLVEQTVRRIQAQFAASGVDSIAVHQLMGGVVSRDWTQRPEDDAVIVGTLDQLLSRALMRGYGVSRYGWPIHYALLHNDALWVFDEVQLMGEALATSVQLDGIRSSFPPSIGPVQSVWMSATVKQAWLHTVDRRLPERILMVDHKDRVAGLGPRLAAIKELARIERIDASSVVEAHKPGTLTLITVNTVATARELATKLQGLAAETLLIHSRFRPDDRRAATEELTKPIDPDGPGRIAVATQVVEAGVDVSASTLFTETAPWASLVQRFGRCNRRGEFEDARVFWASPSKYLPYEPDEIAQAEGQLTDMEGASVGPDALEALDPPISSPPRRFVLRRRDFIGLFDTAPDLSGLDLDVQRYIRDGDDLAVSLAWRELDGQSPGNVEIDLQGEELCPAPIGEMRKAIDERRRGQRVWRFDALEGQWVVVSGHDLRPGDRLLADVTFGCYTSSTGFDPNAIERVDPIATSPSGQPEAVGTDREQGAWLSVAEHTDGVVAVVDDLIAELGDALTAGESDALRVAARYHDWGKAHPVFQKAMHSGDGVPDGLDDVILAKRVAKAPRYARPGFRHELASVLAYLHTHDPDPLAAYLIAAHHGRVRLGARSLPVETHAPDGRAFVLGCWEGDELPDTDLGNGVVGKATTLHLAPLELGSDSGETYTDTALGLFERLGPYRLAFLEALLRTADSRRSAAEEDAGHA